MAFIRWSIGFSFIVILAGLAVLNIHSVPFTWSPFHETLNLPLYVIALSATALGFITGIFITWINSANTRRIKRKQNKTIKNLEKELETLTSKTHTHPPMDDFFPALSSKNQITHKRS